MNGFEILSRATAFLLQVDPPNPETNNDNATPTIKGKLQYMATAGTSQKRHSLTLIITRTYIKNIGMTRHPIRPEFHIN